MKKSWLLPYKKTSFALIFAQLEKGKRAWITYLLEGSFMSYGWVIISLKSAVIAQKIKIFQHLITYLHRIKRVISRRTNKRWIKIKDLNISISPFYLRSIYEVKTSMISLHEEHAFYRYFIISKMLRHMLMLIYEISNYYRSNVKWYKKVTFSSVLVSIFFSSSWCSFCWVFFPKKRFHFYQWRI